MKRLLLSLGFVIVAAFSLVPALSATTQAAPATVGACKSPTSFFGFPTWYKYLPLDTNCEVVTDGLDGSVVLLVTMAIIEILLFLAGFMAGFLIIYGAFKFIFSQGDSAKVVSARTVIANAVVGLIIAVVASRIVSFIGARLASSTISNSSKPGGALQNANIPQNIADAAAIQDLLGFIFALAGGIALLVITIAGFNFVTSQGEPQKVATARQTILYALVGLVISVFAFTIVKFILGKA